MKRALSLDRDKSITHFRGSLKISEATQMSEQYEYVWRRFVDDLSALADFCKINYHLVYNCLYRKDLKLRGDVTVLRRAKKIINGVHSQIH